jgi:hypothetical protein
LLFVRSRFTNVLSWVRCLTFLNFIRSFCSCLTSQVSGDDSWHD